jgi:hypothetical protein
MYLLSKYGHNIEEQYIHKSYLYYFQIFLHVLMIFEALVNFAIETTIVNKNKVSKSTQLNSLNLI